ncbi:hypothetical protein FVE85_7400 [Porphyridium purpureum]|uniref:Uncharacterized protein n=1 Tax=Porphyridium purpureum TaxID=35688 RepID=A0A5J4Z911_PORPP|nr:hypothetical protein FVE85_7400 [Porphyridium purpureum]|eukprot:POR5936..scf295_1
MASDSGDRTQAATLRQAICAGWLHEWNRTMASRQSHVQRQRHQQCELPAAVRESDLGLSADEALMGWLDRARRAMQGPAVLTVLGSNPASEELWWADTEPHDRAALQLQRKANETDTFQWPFAAATSSSVNSHPLESQSSPEEAEQLLLCLHREWIDMSNTVLSPSIGAEALSASSRANNDPMAADHDLWANALTYLLNSRAHATPVISSSLLAWWLSSVDADLQKSDGFNAHQWYDCLCELQDAHEASAGAASVGVESDASVPTSESTAKGDADVLVDSGDDAFVR